MYISKRSLPKNLKKQDEYLFSNELEKSIPISKSFCLKSFTISSNGTFITPKKINNSITEKSTVHRLNILKYYFLLVKLLLKRKLKIVYKSTFWFTDNWSNGYFHWMLDALPRLYEAHVSYTNATIMLPHQFKSQEYIVSSLNAMGFDNVKFMRRGKSYCFRQLIFQTHLAPTGNYNDETIREMRKTLLTNLPLNNSTKGERIYISRAKAKRRRVINENELIPILKQYGFSIIYFEDYNWEQQVDICRNAKIMIGLHGAGLTNMLFMPKNSKVLELRRSGDAHNNCYFSLASALGLDYYYLQCSTDKLEVLNTNFIVDIMKTEELLSNKL